MGDLISTILVSWIGHVCIETEQRKGIPNKNKILLFKILIVILWIALLIEVID